MAVQLDPQGNETRMLFEFTGRISGSRILEIGCGDGRLTWRYAVQAGPVHAIDPNPDKIARAVQNTPPELRGRVEFQAAGLEDYAEGYRGRRFDLALLSWAL